MDAATLARVVSALGVVYHPTTSNAERATATAFLNDVSQWVPPLDLVRIASDALPRGEDVVWHFALQTLIVVMKTRWNAMTLEEQLAIRDAVMSFVRSVRLCVLFVLFNISL